MAYVPPYPHYNINVEDRSIYTPIVTEFMPMHRPLYPIKAQKGPIGTPIWCPDYSTAVRIFGEETFNYLNTDYFSAEAFYLLQTLGMNGSFIVRLADETATTASLVLECSVTPIAEVPQYEKDEYGGYVLDVDGNPIQLMDVDDVTPLVEPGVKLKYTVRPLAEGESATSLLPTTVEDIDLGVDVTTYPVKVFEAKTPGAHGNNTGFALYFDRDNVDTNLIDNVGANFFTMTPVEKEYGGSTVDPIRDMYSNTFNAFCYKPHAIDPTTDAQVALTEMFYTKYDKNSLLPYNITVRDEYIKEIGAKCLEVETELTELVDEWHVNIVSAMDTEGHPYDHILIDTESEDAIMLNKNVNHYLIGGSDGDLTDTTHETLVQQFFELDINPDIQDSPRYPFTSLFDIGYSLDTTKKMIAFTNIREDVEVICSTQDNANEPNDAYTDESTGAALRAYALLMRESIVKATDCCRVSIFEHCGVVNHNYGKWLPATLWAAMKMAEFYNLDYFNKSIAGLPNSDVDIFKEINWVPNSEQIKSRSWNTGLNYMQYYDMEKLHFPALRTVYRYDTSVLVDMQFVSALTYAKHEIRKSWAKFSGTSMPAAILEENAAKDLTERIGKLFNNKYTFDVRVYQTEEEMKLGYVHHVTISVTAPATNRVWDVDIVAYRENYGG